MFLSFVKRIAAIFVVVACAAGFARAQAGAPQNLPAPQTMTVTKAQHVRVALPFDLLRFAVGDPEILSAEPIGTRELLLLGKGSGRTTMIVWFRNGDVQEFVVTVQRDLSILQSALSRLYPTIEVEIAPDRDAIILSGTVPDLSYSLRAEALAHDYINAGPRVLIPAAAPAPGTPPAAPAAAQPGVQAPAQAPVPGQPPAVNVVVQGQTQPVALPTGTVINLIQLENLPPTPEEKIQQAIQGIGGVNVTIRRILKGFVRDDSRDVLVFEGAVPNQIALVRILSLASQILLGQTATEDDIHVIADEAGALANNQLAGQFNTQSLGFGGASQLFGGTGVTSLQNQVRKNIARAKAIELAGGRIISFLSVADLPQVRVGVRIFEINRNKLQSFSPNLVAAYSSATTKAAYRNVLAFLGGSAANEFQLAAGHFAVDATLAYLERVGVARSLSTPSLTVLSGEEAIFQVGGEIPIQQAFVPFGTPVTPATGTNAQGTTFISTFISTTFVSFGVQLNIRPLVGDDDTITLDVQPRIVQPNTALTLNIRASTGTNPLTTAFQTRALRTSARLQDGQALLIGGLLTRDMNNTQGSTPGLRSVIGLGWLFRDYQKVDDNTDLVLLINPEVLRDPAPGVQLWEYPDRDELLKCCGSLSSGAQPGATPFAGSGVSHDQ